jgi:hypothetical protein
MYLIATNACRLACRGDNICFEQAVQVTIVSNQSSKCEAFVLALCAREALLESSLGLAVFTGVGLESECQTLGSEHAVCPV